MSIKKVDRQKRVYNCKLFVGKMGLGGAL